MQQEPHNDWRNESFCAGVSNEGQQGREVASDIEQTYRFSVQSELRPASDLEKLIKSAEASWKCDEAICEIGHQGFSFMHAAHFVQFCEMPVCDLPSKQPPGYDADYLATPFEYGIGYYAH